jgi:hypothetical protein
MYRGWLEKSGGRAQTLKIREERKKEKKKKKIVTN